MTLKRRRDVDAFVKGNHRKGSGSQGTDLCKKCDQKGHRARDRRGGREEAVKGTKGDDGKRTGKGKRSVKSFDGNCGKLWKVMVAGLKFVGQHVQRNQQGRVKKVQKLSKLMLVTSKRKQKRTPRKTAENCQNALCLVSFNVMPDEELRSKESADQGGIDKLKFVQIMHA